MFAAAFVPGGLKAPHLGHEYIEVEQIDGRSQHGDMHLLANTTTLSHEKGGDDLVTRHDGRGLVHENPDIRWSMVIGAYQDRQINLGKAAELLELTELELRDRFVELGIPLRIGSADLAEARAEVAAIRAWFPDTPVKDES